MEKKFWKSKRFYGILIAVVGKILPMVLPGSEPFVTPIVTAGGLLFGYGCMDARGPVMFKK